MRIEVLTESKDITEFVLNKSIDSNTASYIRLHTMNDVINTLDREIKNEFGELFAIYEDEKLQGVFSYFWIDTEKYIQTTVFVIEDNYNAVADMAVEYMKKNKDKYKLFIGIPAENTLAVSFLENKGKLVENSVNLRLDNYNSDYVKNDNVIKISKDNFIVFEQFYEKYAIKHNMYWNSKNLYNDIDKFDIFSYVHKDEIIGVIFAKNGKSSQEVYGLFTDSEDSKVYNGLLRELINCFVSNSDRLRVTYFIDRNEGMELRNAKEFGFQLQDTYKGFEL